MKRCPECGFRAEDNICPLCGVRMTGISTAGRTLDTHVHRQPGEDCMLPKKEERTIKMPAARDTQRRSGGKNEASKLVSVIVVIVIAILMRACDL